jgi:hypothetical protein
MIRYSKQDASKGYWFSISFKDEELLHGIVRAR